MLQHQTIVTHPSSLALRPTLNAKPWLCSSCRADSKSQIGSPRTQYPSHVSRYPWGIVMRSLTLVISVLLTTTLAFSQEQHTFSFWGTAGLGLSSFGHSSSGWGTQSSLGLGIEWEGFNIKYKRSFNQEVEMFVPQEEAHSHEILMGYMIVIWPQSETPRPSSLRLGAHVGIGSFEQVTRGRRIISSHLFGDTFEMIKESSVCCPADVEIRFLFSRYFGFAATGFSLFSRFSPLYGGQINILLGCF
jgi:hypothetical protein